LLHARVVELVLDLQDGTDYRIQSKLQSPKPSRYKGRTGGFCSSIFLFLQLTSCPRKKDGLSKKKDGPLGSITSHLE
jgi:hypothetical protein